MTKLVSYVSDEAIEKDAQALLAEHAHARGVPIEAPIAIDDINEKHLKIGIEFDDTLLSPKNDDLTLDSFAKPFAEKFLVSPIAMRIRLEKLGLLHRSVPLQRLLSDGVVTPFLRRS
jgi:hypothetical protein